MVNAKEMALAAAKALDSKLGKDISLIEIADVSTLADYFLICTATSNTHVKTLCDAVEEAMDAAGEPLLNREGHRGGKAQGGCRSAQAAPEAGRAVCRRVVHSVV